jgi:transcriptional regulator
MLTKKEIDVLTYKKQGLTQIEISKKMNISQPAVSHFYSSAVKKIKESHEILDIAKKLRVSRSE